MRYALKYHPLWFAFKLISLSYWIQHPSASATWTERCDLLSNLYLCHIGYSNFSSSDITNGVVICFQTYIFVILDTAIILNIEVNCSLWFAFKLISLSYWIQHLTKGVSRPNSCDLLSNLYLCHIGYSLLWVNGWICCVVICFQTYIFVILDTASTFNK